MKRQNQLYREVKRNDICLSLCVLLWPQCLCEKRRTIRKNYFDNPTRDYHGGYARQHHAEMRQIALQTVQEVAPKLVDEICTAIWNDALQRLVGAMEYDVNTCVSIAFDDAEKIFKSKEAQRFISDKIVKELQREIDKIGTIKIR